MNFLIPSSFDFEEFPFPLPYLSIPASLRDCGKGPFSFFFLSGEKELLWPAYLILAYLR